MTFVDTNVLFSWLLGNRKQHSVQAEALVNKAKAGSLLITDIVVAEVVYVMRATGRDRQQTAEALWLLGRTAAFKYENEELITQIIDLLVDTKLDFADCYLLARARREKLGLATFDRALKKLYLAG